MTDTIQVQKVWLRTLTSLAKAASKYNEDHPGGEYSALIGFASSAETLLKREDKAYTMMKEGLKSDHLQRVDTQE